ncbi:DUF7344 domain-containing protein [Haloarchaeobius baliensis]|uniref:DUF7344 domain-containing protein n=1 Tax=Haloarchaeobius baliensis TaxID=1670458 RepID=UPI003F881E15
MNFAHCYPDKAPAIDRLLDALQDSLRREVVYYFENCTGAETATLDELVDHIDGRVPSPAREELRLQLRHVHLPKLAAADLLEYDPRTDRVRYRGSEHGGWLLQEVADIF